jgi:diketogulonate reductase-like aldo/keto reductase
VIVGAKKIEQLDDNIGATEVKLDAQELGALDKVSALPPEYPGWMFDMQGQYRKKQIAAAER